MATTPTPAVPAPPSMSAVSRIFGALFNPKPTFADIAARPAWVAPVILLTVLSLVVCVIMAQKVDWASVVAKGIEQSPRAAQLTEAQKQQQIEIGAKFSRVFVYVIGVIGPILSVLILAGVFLLAFNLVGRAGAKFNGAMGVTAHALVPSVLSSILGIVVLLVKPAGSVDPEHMLATNLGEFLSAESPRWMLKLAASVDIFAIWILLLVSLGFAALSPKKLTFGKAAGITFSVYIVFRLIVTGWAAAFS